MKTFDNEIKKIFEKLKNGDKFSFSKYADGEWAMMLGKPLNNKEFEYTHNDEFYRQKLIDSYKFKDKNYYLGIACPCCCLITPHGNEHYDYKSFSEQDEDHLTFANIFVNSNYEFYKNNFIPEYSKRLIHLVANKNAKIENLPFKVEKFYPVENTAWKHNYNLIDEIKGQILNDKLFLFACGPLGNLLAHQLWENNKNNTYMDIGSTLNPWLQSEGFKRDYYIGNAYSRQTCVWG